jgi:hypothetical protein
MLQRLSRARICSASKTKRSTLCAKWWPKPSAHRALSVEWSPVAIPRWHRMGNSMILDRLGGKCQADGWKRHNSKDFEGEFNEML